MGKLRGSITALVSQVRPLDGVATVTTQGEVPVTYKNVPVTGTLDVTTGAIVLLDFVNDGELPVVTGVVPLGRIQKFNSSPSDAVDPADVELRATVGDDGYAIRENDPPPAEASLDALVALKSSVDSRVVSAGMRSLFGDGAEKRDLYISQAYEVALSAGIEALQNIDNASYYTTRTNSVTDDGFGNSEMEW